LERREEAWGHDRLIPGMDWNENCVTGDLSATPNFMAITPSSNDEILSGETPSTNFRESRIHDAENIRQDFIKSKGLLIHPKSVKPASKGTTQDEH